MISSIFHAILYQPLFNIFVWLYDIIPGHDLGLVVLIITILTRLVLYPLMASSIKAQKSMQEMQPKLEAIKKEFASDKQKQAQATMELYKTHKINPFTSCLPLLIQLPLLIALFWVLRDGLASKDMAQNLYPFVHNPGQLNAVSFGLFNLAAPSIVLAILAGLAQFVQARMMTQKKAPKEAGEGAKDEDMTAAMNKQMTYLMPVMTAIIGLRLPAGVTLYWFFSTLLLALQQWIVFRQTKASPAGEVQPKNP